MASSVPGEPQVEGAEPNSFLQPNSEAGALGEITNSQLYLASESHFQYPS